MRVVTGSIGAEARAVPAIHGEAKVLLVNWAEATPHDPTVLR